MENNFSITNFLSPKNEDLSLEIKFLRGNSKDTVTLNDTTSLLVSQLSQNDANNKTKPTFKKYCTFCDKSIHSVFACFRCLSVHLIKDRLSQTKSPTPSFYIISKILVQINLTEILIVVGV